MNKYEKIYCLTGTKKSNWINLCIVPLCLDIAEATGFDVKFYGPFGLESINQQFAGSTVAVPYLMGCCRGGGDWKIVAKIINESLKDCDVTAYHWAE